MFPIEWYWMAIRAKYPPTSGTLISSHFYTSMPGPPSLGSDINWTQLTAIGQVSSLGYLACKSRQITTPSVIPMIAFESNKEKQEKGEKDMKWRGTGGRREGWKREEARKQYASGSCEFLWLGSNLFGRRFRCSCRSFTVSEGSHSLDMTIMTVNKRGEATRDRRAWVWGRASGTLPKTF